MKIQSHQHNNCRPGGFTAVEMMVAAGVMVMLGLVFFQVLNAGIILYAKNTAVNTSHQETRDGINRLTRDIHASVSVPQLRDSTHDTNYTVTGSFAAISSTPVGGVPPTAAGVSFQNITVGNPNYVWKDPGNDQKIQLKDNPNPPVPGMRLIVPFWGIEDDISKVSGNSASHSNVETANAMEAILVKKAPTFVGGDAYAVTYFTDRVLYVVEDGTYIADPQGPWIRSSGAQYVAWTSGSVQRYRFENGKLNLYKQRKSGNNGPFYWQYISTVAKYLSSPQPFYVPLNSGGSPDTKFVGVKLSTRDPNTSNRRFLATASLLDTKIDYRSRICLYQ